MSAAYKLDHPILGPNAPRVLCLPPIPSIPLHIPSANLRTTSATTNVPTLVFHNHKNRDNKQPVLYHIPHRPHHPLGSVILAYTVGVAEDWCTHCCVCGDCGGIGMFLYGVGDVGCSWLKDEFFRSTRKNKSDRGKCTITSRHTHFTTGAPFFGHSYDCFEEMS